MNAPQSDNGRCQVAVIIPAHNEERFIGSVVLKARRYADVVVVVDDGSADETAAVARAAGAVVLRHEKNRGKGAALTTGFRGVQELRPAVVVTLDGDGQHAPAELVALVAPVLAGEADIVVGSRYLDVQSDVPRHRVWGHRVFTTLTNTLSGVRVTDSQSGFRAFSPRAVEAVSFQSDGFSVESEMQFLAHECGLTMAEVPVTILYTDRPKRSVVGQGMQVLNGILQFIGLHRPLMFFGSLGMLLLLVGLGLGTYVVVSYRGELATGYALISTFLVMMGTFTVLVGIILHSMRSMLLTILKDR